MRLKVSIALLALWTAGEVRAADPQPYRVQIQGTGIAPLDTALRASSQLDSLRTSAPAGPFALIGRAQQDLQRLRTALESFGYYRSTLKITINEHALDEIALPDLIEALPKDSSAKVKVAIELGPLFHLRHVSLDGTVSAAALKAFALSAGAPAVASEVLAARQRLADAIAEEGHPFVKVDEPVAYLDASEPVLDVSLKLEPGPECAIGAIEFHGLRQVHEAFLRRRLLLHSGERYSPSKLERARTDLLSLGTFSGISVHTATAPDAEGRVPVVFEVQERKRHAVSLSAGYSSDLGASAGVTWSDRNLFGNAEQLNLTGSLINWGGSATQSLGYDVGAQLIKPDFLRRDQSWQVSLGALKQQFDAYDQTATTAGTSLSRKLSSVWTLSAGLSIEQEHILQEGAQRDYTLFAIPLSAKYDSTELRNPLDDPTHGLRVSAQVAPTESLGNGHATFLIIQAMASSYFDLTRLGWSQPGRSVLALRALAAEAHGADTYSLPPDQRFYGGGSTTVRGYRYQSIGPQFPDGNPIGGTALDALGAEWRQRFGRNWGAALFVDGGEVSSGSLPFQGALSVGYGGGVRYYTPIGPLRIDIALPAMRIAGGDAFELYIGLGQAF